VQPGSVVFRILAKSSWRFYRQHPAQLILSILGIVLGVGIVTAVLITNNSSQRAFALSTESLYGRTTHQLSGANGLDQSTYVTLRKRFDTVQMAPIITGHVTAQGRVYTLLGLDPFAEADFNRFGVSMAATATANQAQSQSQSQDQSQATLQLLLQTNALIVGSNTAQSDSLPVGNTLQLDVGGEQHLANLVTSFDSDNPASTAGLMIGDIAYVQMLLERGNKIDQIDLILNDDEAQAIRTAIPDSLLRRLLSAPLRL